ncbi:hypothetical protein SAMD00019534_028470, partial [Acytostelium subglobosum LB1]
ATDGAHGTHTWFARS